MVLICIMSHQAKLIEVCKQPPGVDISQAVSHLQVCECSRKHLKVTKTSEREQAQASIEFLIHCCKEWKTQRDFYMKLTDRNSVTGGKAAGVGFRLGLVFLSAVLCVLCVFACACACAFVRTVTSLRTMS